MSTEFMRSLRRHHVQRMKIKWHSSHRKNAFEESGAHKDDKATQQGRFVHTRKLCSCWMCGNPRKYEGRRTIQERRALQDLATVEYEEK